MPNQPKTPLRSIRIPEETWEAAKAKALREETTVSAVILAGLRSYIAADTPLAPGR